MENAQRIFLSQADRGLHPTLGRSPLTRVCIHTCKYVYCHTKYQHTKIHKMSIENPFTTHTSFFLSLSLIVFHNLSFFPMLHHLLSIYLFSSLSRFHSHFFDDYRFFRARPPKRDAMSLRCLRSGGSGGDSSIVDDESCECVPPRLVRVPCPNLYGHVRQFQLSTSFLVRKRMR